MATDSKIKLLIQTALDAAGIKATEEQLKKMSGAIAKTNTDATASTGELEKALGKLKGPLGDVGKALGGIGGKVSMLAGAFATGMEIGGKFSDMLQKIWPAYERYINGGVDLEAQLKRHAKAVREAAKAWDEEQAAMEKATDAEIAKSDRIIKGIQAQSQARLYAAKMQGSLLSAGDDAEIQKLERERFEDMLTLQRNGFDQGTMDQVDKLYDVYRSELEAKKQIAAFDRESAQLVEQRATAEAQVAELMVKAEKAEDHYWKLADKWMELNKGPWSDEVQRRMDKLDKQMDAAREKADALDDDADVARSRARVDAIAQDELREAQRATLVSSLDLNTDKARAAYDAVTEANGNAAGFYWSQEYLQKNYDQSVESYRQLLGIQENTSALAEKLDELLAIKGN